ncbi:MAG: hypothetical protein IPI85_03045 [Dehalococcoidia bacterium]|nr:hypothetical protein [Dehalococcoidia bacterium]
MQYLRARYYDPVSGTFLSRDPLASRPSWTTSVSAYAGANPTNGLSWCRLPCCPVSAGRQRRLALQDVTVVVQSQFRRSARLVECGPSPGVGQFRIGMWFAGLVYAGRVLGRLGLKNSRKVPTERVGPGVRIDNHVSVGSRVGHLAGISNVRDGGSAGS